MELLESTPSEMRVNENPGKKDALRAGGSPVTSRLIPT
jgi:hypothetical protein